MQDDCRPRRLHRSTPHTLRALLLPCWLFALLGAPPALLAQTVGPAQGALVVVGGGMQDADIIAAFLALAGGTDAPIVVIPTAGGGDYGPAWGGLEPFREAGATNLKVLHTYDPAVANTEAFAAPLRTARGVWFSGGRQWRLADAYLHTRVHDALNALLARGGVIGGSSAGATILGSYLARGDTRTNTVMMGDHEEGMGFLKNTAIDQHLLKRNRQFDLIEIIQARPELLGIGIDEDTALIVRGDHFEVIGQGYVAIYDHNKMIDTGGRFYFLAPGDRFDLSTREAFRVRQTQVPLERVAKRSWKQQ